MKKASGMKILGDYEVGVFFKRVYEVGIDINCESKRISFSSLCGSYCMGHMMHGFTYCAAGIEYENIIIRFSPSVLIHFYCFGNKCTPC